MVLNAGRRETAGFLDLDDSLILCCPLRSTVLGIQPVGEIDTCWSRLTRGPTLSRCVTGRARTVRGYSCQAGLGGKRELVTIRDPCVGLVAVAVCFACVCVLM